MMGLVMAGGLGTRMGADAEKLLMLDPPVVLGVVSALRGAGLEVVAAVSKNAPSTRRVLQRRVRTVETAGAGYSADLAAALASIQDDVFVCPGDLPLLDSCTVSALLPLYDRGWTSVVLGGRLCKILGRLDSDCMRPDDEHPNEVHTGISMVNARLVSGPHAVRERMVRYDDPRLAINLNSINDAGLYGSIRRCLHRCQAAWPLSP